MADERGSARGRRLGYVVAAGVNLVAWILANVAPGWEVVPFLNEETAEVLPVFNVAVLSQFAANLAYAVFDSTGLRRVVEVPLSAISLALALRIATVYPFAFDETQQGWDALVHVIVYLGVIGAAIALIVNLALLVRWIIVSATTSSHPV